MDLTKVISTVIDSVSRRVVKVLRYGKSDVQNVFESSPFGMDSNPVKDLIAVYSETSLNGKPVIIGYINKNQLAGVGESRIYSTNENGELKFFIWLKNDGTMQIGGSNDNAVRYTALNTGLQDEVTKINTELAKIAAAISGLGGTYTVTPISVDISGSKINEVKTL